MSYDIVLVSCPFCGIVQEVQSKGGQCNFVRYWLPNAPIEVLADVNWHAPFTCICGKKFKIVTRCNSHAEIIP